MTDRELSNPATQTVTLIIPGAGDGTRLGLGIPKALVPIAGVPMLRRTLARFARCESVAEIIVTAPAAYVAEFEVVLAEGAATSGDGPVAARVIAGGATRQHSVELGLRASASTAPLVCVHDAARPLVSITTITAVIEAASRSGAATAASRPADSVREETPQGGSRALDRARLWMIETPQVFTRALLEEAHRKARDARLDATDDATLVERLCGVDVAIVQSEGANIKVTSRSDLDLAALLCR